MKKLYELDPKPDELAMDRLRFSSQGKKQGSNTCLLQEIVMSCG